MEKKQRVNVFKDPVTKNFFEGEAIIKKIIMTPEKCGADQFLCRVTFKDGFSCLRLISENDILKDGQYV